MFFHILKKDLKRKRTMNVILLLFIILSTLFLASSVNNLVVITGAVGHFIEISKVPDYFAIAVLEQQEDEIANYLEKENEVTEYEVMNSFCIANDRISIATAQEGEKYECTNTICMQAVPENFMKVFDAEGNPLVLTSGEIAFPKVEAENNGLQVGDRVEITVGDVRQEFTIAALTLDAVFGSSMMGFKRLLIAREDFERFAAQENLVYTNIYCVDCGDAETFLNGFNQQSFKLVSGAKKELVPMLYVFDMLIAGILIIVSICLILIAFLVLRFTIVFTLQEDYREIGIMKAIGMRDAGIKRIYLVKYLAIAVAGAAVGFGLSFPFGEMLLQQAKTNIIMENAGHNYRINVLCAMGIVGIVLVFCNSSANKLKRFSAIEAIRNGSNGERYQGKSRMRLWKRKQMKPGLYLAYNDILSTPKRFAALGITFCIGTLLILLPLSALDTLRGDGIINLFGLSSSDVYLDNGKTDSYTVKKDMELILSDLREIEETLQEHGISAKTRAELLYTIPVYADNPGELYNYNTSQGIGTWEAPYAVLEGREPILADEIMITELLAEEMDVTIGDSIYFQYQESTQEYRITGMYQTMMNMGYGLRVGPAAELRMDYFSGMLGIQVKADDLESEVAYERIGEVFLDYEVKNTEEFLNSMIGDIVEQINLLIYLISGVVLAINSLITVLMMKSMMTKERGDIALLKNIGFRNRSIRLWQMERILLILAAAIVMGTLLSRLIGPFIIGPIFSMMGASSITLEVNPLGNYVICPLALLLVTGCSAFVCTGEVKKVDLKEVGDAE